MEPRESIDYLKDLLSDITFAIEQEDSQANHGPSDLLNLKHAIDTLKHQQDTIRMYKVVDGFIKKESKKVKHIFPLENTAGYGQLCDKVIELTDNSIPLEKVYQECISAWKEATGEKVKPDIKEFFRKQIFKKEHEKTFIAVMAKELVLQTVDGMERHLKGT